MLHILTKAHTPGMGANRHTEVGGQKQYCQVSINTGNLTAVDLADIDRSCLEELLGHDAAVAVLSGSNAR
jgi:hypothetical protein